VMSEKSHLLPGSGIEMRMVNGVATMWYWKYRREEAFQRLKQASHEAPVLALPSHNHSFLKRMPVTQELGAC